MIKINLLAVDREKTKRKGKSASPFQLGQKTSDSVSRASCVERPSRFLPISLRVKADLGPQS